MTLPAEDHRSVDDLLAAAMASDDDAAWDAIAALHWRGSKEVFDHALALTKRDEPAARARGADILGQLGIPDRTFPDQSFDAVVRLLSDESRQVQFASLFALQHLDRLSAAPHVMAFAKDEDDSIRYAVAFALGAVDTPASNAVLLELMNDQDGEVRNWATFGLGQQSDADSNQIREALAERLTDDDADVRYEAVIGLGRRRDGRALGFLKTMLHDDPDDVFARDAAARLLGFDASGDSSTTDLLGSLQRRQRWSSR